MKPPPFPGLAAGSRALVAWVHEKSILGALSSLQRDLGEVFRIPLPGFAPVMLVGAEANRFVLVEQHSQLHWRMRDDPVGHLLRNGLLMLDGEAHDRLRRVMSVPLQRGEVAKYVERMAWYTDALCAQWDDAPRDMLAEMRRLTLLILMDTLFGVDLGQEVHPVCQSLLRALEYISPGVWLVWKGIPRPNYREALRRLDAFIYALIAARRKQVERRGDVLDHLLDALGADDEWIRDQVLTLLIAGHDTSAALLAWTLYLLGKYPETQERARNEVRRVCGTGLPQTAQLGRLVYLECIIKESLRLYPPIHIGNRRAARDLAFQGYAIPKDTRVVYSIYLSHRDPRSWHAPHRFVPERFAPAAEKAPPLAYVPFGGGPRFCIGATFAQVEAKSVLARLLTQFAFELLHPVHPHLGATLEPRPGVWMRVRRL